MRRSEAKATESAAGLLEVGVHRHTHGCDYFVAIWMGTAGGDDVTHQLIISYTESRILGEVLS